MCNLVISSTLVWFYTQYGLSKHRLHGGYLPQIAPQVEQDLVKGRSSNKTNAVITRAEPILSFQKAVTLHQMHARC